jgi:hypothetical protein
MPNFRAPARGRGGRAVQPSTWKARARLIPDASGRPPLAGNQRKGPLPVPCARARAHRSPTRAKTGECGAMVYNSAACGRWHGLCARAHSFPRARPPSPPPAPRATPYSCPSARRGAGRIRAGGLGSRAPARRRRRPGARPPSLLKLRGRVAGSRAPRGSLGRALQPAATNPLSPFCFPAARAAAPLSHVLGPGAALSFPQGEADSPGEPSAAAPGACAAPADGCRHGARGRVDTRATPTPAMAAAALDTPARLLMPPLCGPAPRRQHCVNQKTSCALPPPSPLGFPHRG